jgi:hypothetical protein
MGWLPEELQAHVRAVGVALAQRFELGLSDDRSDDFQRAASPSRSDPAGQRLPLHSASPPPQPLLAEPHQEGVSTHPPVHWFGHLMLAPIVGSSVSRTVFRRLDWP